MLKVLRQWLARRANIQGSRAKREVLKSEISNLKSKKGFTLIEIIIVVGILAILAITTTNYLLPYQRKITLKGEAGQIASYLQQARTKSISKEDDKIWGVHFENPSSGDDFFQLYYTDTGYPAGTPAETIYLSFNVEFQDLAPGNVKNIQFSEGSGTTTAASISVFLNNISYKISVNSEGMVSLKAI